MEKKEKMVRNKEENVKVSKKEVDSKNKKNIVQAFLSFFKRKKKKNPRSAEKTKIRIRTIKRKHPKKKKSEDKLTKLQKENKKITPLYDIKLKKKESFLKRIFSSKKKQVKEEIKPEKKEPFLKRIFSSKKKKIKEEIKPKKYLTHYELKEKQSLENKKKGFNIFLLVLALIVGAGASLVYPNIFVYIGAGIAVVYTGLRIGLYNKKTKKVEKEEDKPKLKEEKIYITYKTDFDKFYEYIKEKGRTTLTEVASHFKMPKKQVEEWSAILEQHGLIKINYPLFKEQELVYKE